MTKKEKSYRKIWIEHFGPIPVDETGRSYEIHHINGDHYDNRIENLQCLSIVDHLKIHLAQNDFLAASSIAQRMNLSKETISRLSRKGGIEAKEKKKGIHGLTEAQRKENGAKGAKAIVGMLWYNNGTVSRKFREIPDLGIWIRGKLPSGSGPKIGSIGGYFWNNGIINVRSVNSPGPEWIKGKLLSKNQLLRRKEIGRRKKTDEEKKNLSEKMTGKPHQLTTCPYCNKTGSKNLMKRYHFNNCKENKNAGN